MKKLLVALTLSLLPCVALATTSVPWLQTNLTDTFISPAQVNGLTQGILVNSSSTLQNYTFVNATGSQATTTSFGLLGTKGCNTSSALTTNSSGAVVCGAISGSGTVPGGSDTQVQFNDGGTTFGGNANLTFQKLTGLLTGLSSLFTFSTTTNFLATGSSTLQNFTFVNATGSSATTTNFFSTTASSTNLFGQLINGFGLSTCTGTNALTWTGGSFSCTAQPQGTVTSVTGTANRVTSTGGATPQIDISGSYVGQSSITTVGTLSAGAVPASLVTNGTFGSGNYTFPSGLTITGSATLNGSLIDSAASAGTGGYVLMSTGAATQWVATSTLSNATAYKQAANYATTAALPANNYANGSSGVGATITEIGVGALSVDGASPSVGQRVLIKNEGTAANNGIYTVTAAGSGIAAFVLTRATDYNTSLDIFPGVANYVVSGTVNGDSTWVMNSASPITVGTTALNYSELGAGGANFTAGSVIYSDGSALSQNNSNFFWRNGLPGLGLGTSTPMWTLNIASSTRSQLTLSDGISADDHWSFRNAGGQFYLATSSPSTFATSSTAVMSIDGNGQVTFANHVVITGNATATNATTTNLFTTTASTTNLYLATGNCSGSSALNVSSGKVTCGAVSGSGSASTTLLTDNNAFTGLDTFTDLKAVTRSTTTQATTTSLAITSITSRVLSTDGNGSVIATTTPSFTKISSNNGTVNLPSITGILPILIGNTGSTSVATSAASETNLATSTIPAGIIGANGGVRIVSYWKFTGTAGTKTVTIRHSTTAGDTSVGTTLHQLAETNTNLSVSMEHVFYNNNSQSSQTMPIITSRNLGTNSSSAFQTGSINTANTSYLNFNCQTANAGDTCQLAGFTVEVLPFFAP